MDIAAVNRNLAAPVAAPAVPADRAAENREIVQAVKAVNAAELLGKDSELVFQRDPRTQKIVIRVMRRGTDEVLSQTPPEYVLRLAESLK